MAWMQESLAWFALWLSLLDDDLYEYSFGKFGSAEDVHDAVADKAAEHRWLGRR
jgi:hypothetical protein